MSRLALRSRNVVNVSMACEASRPLRATARIALAPGHVADRVAGQGQSTPRCRRIPSLAAGLIVDAIVIDGRTLSHAVPDSNRTCSPWFEYDVADRIADQHCDAARRPQGGLAQSAKLFLSKVNLRRSTAARFLRLTQRRVPSSLQYAGHANGSIRSVTLT